MRSAERVVARHRPPKREPRRSPLRLSLAEREEISRGKAATVAAALREVPGVWETASVAGPYDVIARAQAPDIDELAKLAASQVQDLDGVTRTLTCPVVHL